MLALIPSLVALITEHQSPSDTHNLPKKESKSYYVSLATSLGLNHSGYTRNALADQIEKHYQKENARWRKFKITCSAIGLMILAVVVFLNPKIADLPPNIALGWYEATPEEIKLTNIDSVKAIVDAEDIIKSRIRIPINLALNNRENENIEIEKIEIYYPKSIDIVSSSGKRRIDPHNRVIIYEHEIETLANVSHYTPIATIDTIAIKSNFIFESGITFTFDSIPFLTSVLADDNIIYKRNFEFNVVVRAKDRPRLSANFKLRLDGNVDAYFDLKDGKLLDNLSGEDLRLFNRNNFKDLNSHSVKLLFDGTTKFECKELEDTEGIYQFLYLNDRLRRVIIDTNKDGYVDKEIRNNDSDPEPDYLHLPSSPYKMVDWSKFK